MDEPPKRSATRTCVVEPTTTRPACRVADRTDVTGFIPVTGLKVTYPGDLSPMTYKSSFQDRAGQAAEAKRKALEQLRARPPVDEKVAAERMAAGQKRETARAEKAASKKAAKKTAAEAAVKDAASARAAAAAVPKTEAELKAARDARYAKRKARK
jgi:hypothetical protein